MNEENFTTLAEVEVTKYKRQIPEENLESFLVFLEERQNIWYRKEVLKEPRPWTEDPTLNEYFFTNIYREQDRVSQWEINNIILPFNGELREQLRRIILLRFTNSIDTYLTLVSKDDCLQALDELHKQKKLISPAIMFTPKKGFTRVTWVKYFADYVNTVIDQLYKSVLEDHPEATLLLLEQLLPRCGKFYAYEFLTSLTYCRDYRWTENDFLIVGPGAVPGLKILFGTFKIKDPHYWVMKLYPYIRQRLIDRGEMKWPSNPEGDPYKFTARTFEHSLCEFRKYRNLKNPDRRSRKRRYPVVNVIN